MSQPEIVISVDGDSLRISRDDAPPFAVPLTQVLPLIRSLQEAVRHLPPHDEAFPSYLNAPDSGVIDFSEEEILISLYAETVEDEEEFARRTLVMRRVSAALYACAGISTPALKRMRMPAPDPAKA